MPRLKHIRHELFCLAILNGMSQKDAAIKAGYKVSRAIKTGSDLVTNRDIIDRIIELHEKIESKAIMKPKERKEILSEIGRGRLTDFIDTDGQPTLDENTPHGRAAAEYSIRETYNKQGDPVITKSIKLHNPIPAINELNKMEHIYEDKTPEGRVIVNSFTFILPDGTRVSPKELKGINAIDVKQITEGQADT